MNWESLSSTFRVREGPNQHQNGSGALIFFYRAAHTLAGSLIDHLWAKRLQQLPFQIKGLRKP